MIVCDNCKKTISVHDVESCEQCGEDTTHYHYKCLTEVDNELLCPTHIPNCGKCQLQVTETNECCACDEIGSDVVYHKACLTIVRSVGEWYCEAHFKQRTQAIETLTIISKYASQFWNAVGFKLTKKVVEDDWLLPRITFEIANTAASADKCNLAVGVSPVTREGSEEIIALRHDVTGIAANGRSYTISIINHDEAVKLMRRRLVGSIRSKKSLLTQEFNRELSRETKSNLYASAAFKRERTKAIATRRAEYNEAIARYNKLIAQCLDE